MMVKQKSWEEFRENGLLWWINTSLHMFGWAICYEFDYEGKIENVYPARVKFRGFGDEQTEKGYQKVSKYLLENIEEIERETK